MSSITRNLPWFISQPVANVIGDKCYVSLVENLDFHDAECLKLSFSKVLGLGIVVGGSVVKIPQVLLIVNSGSARGLSLPAFSLETLGYAFSLAYSARNHFPFSTYGENLFLAIQNVIVTVLIVYHNPTTSTPGSLRNKSPKNPKGAVVASGIIALFTLFLAIVPHTFLPLLQILTVPISLFSKIPQIASNARAGSTGNLSAIAVFAQVLGCAARLFTTSAELDGDIYVLGGFGMALLLNGILGVQILMYWGKDGVDSGSYADEKKVDPLPASAWPREQQQQQQTFTTTAAPVLAAPVPVRAPVPSSPYRPRVESPVPRAGSASPNPNVSGNRKWARKLDD